MNANEEAGNGLEDWRLCAEKLQTVLDSKIQAANARFDLTLILYLHD